MQQELTFEQSIGQHLVISLQQTEIDDHFRDLVKTGKIGNVILQKRNIESSEQLTALCRDIRELIYEETQLEPLIIIAEEGGTLSALPPDMAHIPGAMAIGATGDPGHAYTTGRILARQLRSLGIQCTIAPNLSVSTSRLHPVTGSQAYSDQVEVAAQFAAAMIRGLTDNGVLAIGSGFPGIGDSDIDEQSGLFVCKKLHEEWEATECVPFAAAIAQHIPALQVGHQFIEALEEQPIVASLSRAVITDTLRDQLQYKGLICTQSLQEAHFSSIVETEHAAVEAIKAGADLILLGERYDAIESVVQALQNSYRNGYLNWEEHEQSLIRIRAAKGRFSLEESKEQHIQDTEEDHHVIRAIMARSISAVNLPQPELFDLGEHPLFIGCYPASLADISATVPFSHYLADRLGGKGIITPEDPTNEEIIALMEETKGTTAIVAGTYNGHEMRGQLSLVNALAGTGLPVVVIALGSPYDLLYLTENCFSYAAYDYTKQAFEAVCSILSKERTATGVLPVHW
jgi:beta-N-acetylhexosaminidase